MRGVFREYYSPAQADYKRLLTEALIVVDANVLLQAYKLPKLGREALLDTLERLKDRLWIPYQVGVEFQANRLGVITDVMSKFDAVLKRGTESLSKIRDEVQQLELDKRGAGVDDAALRKMLEDATRELDELVAKARTDGSVVSHDDPIRDRIDLIIGDRVGPPPATQDVVDALNVEAQKRFDCAIPPGFKDADKDRDPAKAGRYARGIRLERKYGDYYLWRQTLDYVKQSQAKAVLFVTSDNKEDWWQVTSGRTLGPLPALIAEMDKEGECPFFWMYNVRMFLDQANEHLQANISDEALKEVKETEESLAQVDPAQLTKWLLGVKRRRTFLSERRQSRTLQDAVAQWYKELGCITHSAQKGSDLLVVSDSTVRSVRIVEWDPGSEPGPDEYSDLLEMARRAGQDLGSAASEADLVLVVPIGTALSKAASGKDFGDSIQYIRVESGLARIHVGSIGLMSTYLPMATFSG